MTVENVIGEWNRPDAPLHPTMGTDDYWMSAIASGHVAFITEHFPAPCRVLDFACGDGRVLTHLMDAGYEVEGYDTCPAAIERLKAHRPDAIASTKMPRRKFDVVLMLAVLIHYDATDGMEVVRQAWDRVRVGGQLYAGVPYGKEQQAGALGLNIWPEGSIALGNAETVLDSTYPSEHHIFRKVRA